MLTKRRSRESGTTLLEAMVALGIIGVVVTSVITLVTNRYQAQRVNSMKIAKSLILKEVEEGIQTPANIQASMLYLSGPNGFNNSMIASCLTPGNICSLIGPGQMRPFDLIAPNSNVNAPTSLSGLWSNNGLPNCFPPTARACPFTVKTYFYFSCPINPLTGVAPNQCAVPSGLNLVYQMLPTLPVDAKNAAINFYYPGADGAIPDPSAVALRMSTWQITNSPAQACGPGQYVDGYDASGQVNCACYNQQPQRDAAGNIIYSNPNWPNWPTCISSQCPNSQVFVGYTTNGNGDWVAVCNSPAAPACYTIDVTTQSCIAGYYLTQLNFATCQPNVGANKKKKGPGGVTISCPGSASCCSGNF